MKDQATGRRIDAAALVLLGVWVGLLVASAAPDVTWYDSGELAAGGFLLAPTHPPGQILHALLAKLAAFLPLGPVAFRVTVLSVASASVALVFLYAAVRRWHGRAAALGVSGLLATSWAFAEQACRTEVYTLALVGACAAIWLWRPGRVRSQAAATFAAALTAGAHPMLAAAAWIAVVVSGIASAPHRWPRVLAASLAGLAGGSLIWLGLPAAAHRAPVAWSDLRTLHGLVGTILGHAYAANFEPSRTSRLWLAVGNLRVLAQVTGLAWVVALGGLAAAFLRPEPGRILPAALAAAGLLGPLSLGILLPPNPDLHGYFLPAAAGVAWLAASGIEAAGRRLGRHTESAGWAVLLATTAVLGAPRLADRLTWPPGPDEFLVGVGAAAAPGPGLVVADSDHYLFPLLYGQVAEGLRPDLALVNRWLVAADAPLYRRQLKSRWPWLWIPLLDETPQRHHLRLQFVSRNARSLPVYAESPEPGWHGVLQDCGLLVGHGGASPCFAKEDFPMTLAPEPARLVACHAACERARLLASRGRYQEALAALRPMLRAKLPTLWRGASPFLCTRGRPLVLAARILLSQGQSERALPLLERARREDPLYAPTYATLGKLAADSGRIEEAERLFLQAVRLDPNDASAWLGAAWAAHRLGRQREALRRLQRAMELDPNLARRLQTGPSRPPRPGPGEARH